MSAPGCAACWVAGGTCDYCRYWGADRLCPDCAKVTPTDGSGDLWRCAVCDRPRTGTADEGPQPQEIILTPEQVAQMPAEVARGLGR